MAKNNSSQIEKAWGKALELLQTSQTPYLVIGGLAVAVIGEPRATADIDFNIQMGRSSIKRLQSFLKTARSLGFDLNEKQAIADIAQSGAFRLLYAGQRIDFIVASTDFEKSAFERHQKIRLFGQNACFPTPEDLILFKIVPGRNQDLADIERVVHRHRENLDVQYLLHWAKKFSDEAENMRIYNSLKKMLS